MSFADDIENFIQASLTPEVMQQQIEAIGDQQVQQAIQDTGYNRPVLSFTSPTQVDYVFLWFPDAVRLAVQTLIEEAPKKSGQFAGSFYLIVNGTFYPPGSNIDEATSDLAVEVIIGNTQPQDRRVDLQVSGGKPLHFSVPSNMYERAADLINRQYNGLVRAERIADERDFPGRYRQKHSGYRFQSPALKMTYVGGSTFERSTEGVARQITGNVSNISTGTALTFGAEASTARLVQEVMALLAELGVEAADVAETTILPIAEL